jgi:5-methylcytosine-specific restriction protein A
MARTAPEWIGKTDDTPVPPRVRVRIFERDGGRCQCGCGRKILVGESWQTDHRVALINDGENRESNLHTVLTAHHKQKTKLDVAEKSKVYERKRKHLGLKQCSKLPCGRDSPFKKKISGEVVRR